MSILYVLTNGLHTTVVDEDDVTVGQCGFDDSAEGLRKGALAAAIDRFTAAGLDHAGLQVVKQFDIGVEEGSGNGADVSHLGLTEGAFVNAAHDLLSDDDVSVDDDACVAGYHIQTWTWVSPRDLLGHLSDKETKPVSNQRPAPARGQAAEDKLNKLQDQVQSLIGALESNIFKDAPELADQVSEVQEQIAVLKAMMAGTARSDALVAKAVVQTWEVAEGAADDLTDDQRKPWAVAVKHQGSAFTIDVWPAALAQGDAEEGMNLVIEVNKGRPCVHIGPGVHGDNACHVHVLSPSELEVAPATGRAVIGETRVYAGGPELAQGHPRSAFFHS